MSNEWRIRAACQDMDTAVFYPTKRTGETREIDWRIPKSICNNCTVTAECLSDALKIEKAVGAIHGMRGGLTDKERARLVKR